MDSISKGQLSHVVVCVTFTESVAESCAIVEPGLMLVRISLRRTMMSNLLRVSIVLVEFPIAVAAAMVCRFRFIWGQVMVGAMHEEVSNLCPSARQAKSGRYLYTDGLPSEPQWSGVARIVASDAA